MIIDPRMSLPSRSPRAPPPPNWGSTAAQTRPVPGSTPLNVDTWTLLEAATLASGTISDKAPSMASMTAMTVAIRHCTPPGGSECEAPLGEVHLYRPEQSVVDGYVRRQKAANHEQNTGQGLRKCHVDRTLRLGIRAGKFGFDPFPINRHPYPDGVAFTDIDPVVIDHEAALDANR